MTADQDRILLLAAVTLRSAVKGDHDRAGRALQALSDEGGGSAVAFAIAAWCDQLVMQQEQLGMATASSDARVMWGNLDSGRVDTGASAVPAEVGWAGRVLQARAALDRAAFDALMLELGDVTGGDGKRIGDYVGTLLECVAGTMRTLAAGQS